VKRILFLTLLISLTALACKENDKKSLLPYYGPREAGPGGEDDTIYHSVPAFSFVNQEGKIVNNNDYEGKIYVADFFYVKCKGICPKMASQLQRVQERFKNDNTIMILSHTVNPEQDSVEALARYAEEMHVDPKKWNLVTGGKKELYDIARNGYYVTTLEGDGGEEDFIHSETFVLVDLDKHIRGIYDGTNTADVDRMMRDMTVLKQEAAGKKEK
jgi:protein SCO1/2